MTEEKSTTNKTTVSPPPVVALSPEAPAKDGELAINQSMVAPAAVTKKEVVVAAEAPVIISDADVAAAQPSPEQLSDQIEVLTGEIQALESKIERITGTSPATPSATAGAGESPIVQESKPEIKPTVTAPTDTSTFVTAPPAAPVAPAVKSNINDIYPKTTVRDNLESVKTANEKTAGDPMPAPESGSKTAILIVAEALIFFGLAVFLLLILSPLYQETIGSLVTGVLRSIGWPVIIGTSVLGIIASFLAKDTWGLRSMAIVVTLVSAVIFLGTTSYLSLGALAPILEPVLRLYR